ncbi:MAG: TonB-dependent receptor domain-containing protein [Aureispira sp.]
MKHLILLALLFTVAFTANAQKGIIRGVVMDGEMGEPLFSATVVIKGTTNGAITDLDGNFEIKVDQGTVALELSYIGYKTITVEGVEVKANEVTVVNNIVLNEDSDMGIEVVVTAEAIQSNEVAIINIKSKSASMIDGISSDKIRQIGDGNVAEATKRVTGVSVEGGKYVYIRGLGDRYSKTTLNGVDVPGLDPDRNSLQMDIFPTSLISNIIVSKTFTADLPADFTGGLLNIDTKEFPEEQQLSISASTSFNPQYHFNNDFLSYEGGSTDFLGFDDGTRKLPSGVGANIPTPFTSGIPDAQVTNFIQRFDPTLDAQKQMSFLDFSAGLSYGNQISLKKKGSEESTNKKLGYVFSLSYKSNYKHYDQVAYGEFQRDIDPNNYNLTTANLQTGSLSERNFLLGAIGGLAYKTNVSKVKLTVLHLQNGVSRAGEFKINNFANAVGQSGYEAVSDNLEYNQRSLSNVLLSGSHIFDASNWEVDWKLSPTYSTSFDPDIRKTPFSYDGSYSFSSGEAGNPSRIWRSLNEFNATAKIDLKKRFDSPLDLEFKFGASHNFKLRNYEIKLYEILFKNSQAWGAPDPSLVLSADNIYTGDNRANSSYFQSGNTTPNPNEYSSNVNNTGAYVSTSFTILNKLKSTVGLRAEYFIQRHTGRDIAYASGDLVNGNNLKNDKVLESFNLFPTVNMTYTVAPKVNIRGSYTRTIARPSFKELSYAQILDPITNRIFNGSLFAYSSVIDGQQTLTWDGNLKETNIDNVDLRWEWFLPRAQFVSFSAFYKNFNNPIELVRIPEQQTSAEYQPRNVGNGRLLGGEFELRNDFGFISESLEALSFNANVTVVYSAITMTDLEYKARKTYEREGETIGRTRDMAGQSPWVVNAGLSYTNNKIGTNVGLFYNVKGPTLFIVGTGLIPDIYTQPIHSLNFSYNQKLGKNKNTVLEFQVSNLLNWKDQAFYQSFKAENQVFTSFNPGITFSLGVNHKFDFKTKNKGGEE